MSVSRTSLIGLLLGGLALQAGAEAGTPVKGYELEKVVQVSRHGVRPPTAGNTQDMGAVSDRAWPAWSVEDGHLTGHGYAAAVQMGRYRGEQLRHAGLLPPGCPAAGQVFAWASPIQRTRATASALLDGLFPGCGLQPGSVAGELDPLFQTDKLSFAALDPELAKAGILQAMGGSAEQAQKALTADVQRLRQAVCDPGKPCPVADTPWRLEQGKDGRYEIQGLSVAANMAETFRLQYSEGLPLAEVAFGHGRDAQAVAGLMGLLRAKYDFINNTPYIARRGGSQLMNQIALALGDGSGAGAVQGGPPNVPLVMYVAHDTNISYLRTMLGFTWQQSPYPQNNIPPASTLAFERYREVSSGQRFVHIVFEAQSLDQIRSLQGLSSGNPPLSESFNLDGHCRPSAVGLLCPINEVLARMEQGIDRTAVVPYEYQAR